MTEAKKESLPIKPKTPMGRDLQSLEKNFFKNILTDQRDIWTMPFRMHRKDSRWLMPLALTTASLIATDKYSVDMLSKNGNGDHTSRMFSRIGSSAGIGGITAAMYLTGRFTKNDRLRETGLLSAEALINACVVYGAIKGVTQRARPREKSLQGWFFNGGSSFPSGHAASAWAMAAVVAREYDHRPLVKWGAYGFATAVTVSRFTSHKHFLSDMLVGSAIGFGIGRYVYNKHHNPELSAASSRRKKLIPVISPQAIPSARNYGMTLTWGF